MLAKRILVAVILIPIGVAAILFGGWIYIATVCLILGLAAWEYVRLFQTGGLEPAGFLVIGGTLLIVVGRAWNDFDSAPWMLSLLILLSLTAHLVAYERGRDQAATDFGITLGGIFYIGWIGAYLISLRQIPHGQWWVLTVLPSVWLADSGAYFIGRSLGRHKLSPRLSPKKTWEGYVGGIVTGVVGTMLLAALWSIWAGPDSGLSLGHAAVLGLVMGIFPTLGDLGESLVKRQVGVKDSGNLLPGHGGVFDRIDSWLWAGVLGYYLITGLWI